VRGGGASPRSTGLAQAQQPRAPLAARPRHRARGPVAPPPRRAAAPARAVRVEVAVVPVPRLLTPRSAASAPSHPSGFRAGCLCTDREMRPIAAQVHKRALMRPPPNERQLRHRFRWTDLGLGLGLGELLVAARLPVRVGRRPVCDRGAPSTRLSPRPLPSICRDRRICNGAVTMEDTRHFFRQGWASA
jgi:hypothetical protein